MMGMITVEAGSHPVASGVRLKLVAYDEVPAKDSYGSGHKFTFEAVDGPAAGTKAYRTVSSPVRNTNMAGAFFAALLGQPSLSPQMQVDPATLIGKHYIGEIKQSPKGKGSRVESVVVAPF